MTTSADDPQNIGWVRALVEEAKLWVLVEANRWVLSVVLVTALFGAIVILSVFTSVPLEASIRNRDPVESLFQAFVTAIITGVTLVVTITQLVLTNKLGPIEEQRERMAGAMQFRRDVEETLDVPIISANPTDFLDTLIEVAREKVVMFGGDPIGDLDDGLRQGIDEYVEVVIGDADEAYRRLEENQFGTFEPLFAVLEFDYSWKIHEARRLRALHAT